MLPIVFETCTNGAYIVLQNNNPVDVSSKEVEYIYKEILCKFDTSVLSWYFQDLTPQQQAVYPSNEGDAHQGGVFQQQENLTFPVQEILNQKIKERFPNKNYRVEYMPNTLFELASIIGFAKNILHSKIKDLKKSLETITKRQIFKEIPKIFEQAETDASNDPLLYKARVRELFHDFNISFFPVYQSTLQTIAEYNLLNGPDKVNYTTLYTAWGEIFKTLNQKNDVVLFNRQIEHTFPAFSFEQLERILKIEREAERVGRSLIYRATTHSFPFIDSSTY
ncbi:hypothetical protein HCUR_00055 [Holospora curviuscula]|uniref:Uncharacterized protein n=2 Tax=Holospora curviuscula TaxID=1082868 RepID=A0A2S5RHU3_9PROT|nr:hypothetical protein HCUR_00055 [Holospora curviuscula]